MNEPVTTQQQPVTDAQRKQAAQLVDIYNKQAAVLAITVLQLSSLRKVMGETGGGQVIVSADGWKGNALEAIPMLKVEGQDYPKQFPVGMLMDIRKQGDISHFDAGKQASFAMPSGYLVTAESMLKHRQALEFAEQNGVDYITAAITIEGGNK